MFCKGFLSGVLLICVFLVSSNVYAQDTCHDLFEPCDGIAQLYECVSMASFLTDDQGGDFSRILQEYCFKLDSPLFQEISIIVSGGRLNFETLQVEDVVGEVLFDVNLAELGEECPVGDVAMLHGSIVAEEVFDSSANLVVTIDDVSNPMITCVLNYDPRDAEHNSGVMMVGSIANMDEGGVEILLELAELEPGATEPGLDRSDIDGTATPAPLFFNPISKENFFVLPPAGGDLTISTTLSGRNQNLDEVDVSFEEEFSIQPGGALFRRGDANNDGSVNIADAVTVLGHLFSGSPLPDCPDAADGNDDGSLNIADGVTILSYLFAGGELAAPGAEVCGLDESADELSECTYDHCGK